MPHTPNQNHDNRYNRYYRFRIIFLGLKGPVVMFRAEDSLGGGGGGHGDEFDDGGAFDGGYMTMQMQQPMQGLDRPPAARAGLTMR